MTITEKTCPDRRDPLQDPISPDPDSSSSKLSAPKANKIGAFASHLTEEIKPTTFSEIQLIVLTFCTGIQDATTFPDYHCFASNQTGNTVFLCLALIMPQLNGEMFIVSNIGMALGLFLGAGWLTGQLSHIVGPRKRWWLLLCNLIQTCLVFGAAVIQYRHGIQVQSTASLAVIGLLAFAAGSQVVQSRSLGITEISTAMATAAWVDLMIDERLFVLDNRPRTRRAAFLLSLIAGTFVGAAIYKEAGSATAIAVSGGGKLLVTILYLFTNSEKNRKGESAV